MENKSLTEKQSNVVSQGNIARKGYYWAIGAVTLAGVIGGYAYYYFIGCNNGCAIQSNPYLSMIWGGAMGYLLTDMILKPKEN